MPNCTMGNSLDLADLRSKLRREVRRLCAEDGVNWKAPILPVLRRMRESGTEAVFFGGTLRSLLASRILRNRQGHPRDLDIVISGTTVDELARSFNVTKVRKTRFGGLKMQTSSWHFDVWPLQDTWAFKTGTLATAPSFQHLPYTTFLNLEAIAVDVWPTGTERRIFSGDNQFFGGLTSRTVEVNLDDNPYPKLNVVRSLILAAVLGFKVGPRLSRFVTVHGTKMTSQDIAEIQYAHYGTVKKDALVVQQWISWIAAANERRPNLALRLPILDQGTLWESSVEPPNLRLHCTP